MKNHFKVFILFFVLIFPVSLDSVSIKNGPYILKMSKLLKGLDLFLPRLILRNKEKLQLSSKQKEQIETEILSHEKFIIRNGAEIKILELELISLISQEPVNRKKISEKIRESGKFKTNSFLKHLKHLFNIKDILSKRQIDSLAKGLKVERLKVH